MLATYVPPVVTRYSLADMEYSLRVGLTAAIGRPPTDECLAVAMAKCRGETANGNAVWGNNLGNVKCPESATGNYTCILLNEVEQRAGKTVVVWYKPEGELVGGRDSALRFAPMKVPPGHVQTRMRVLANRVDAGHFYIDFIFRRAQYAKARDAMLAGNPQAYAHELKVAGYYTAPEADYVKLVMALYTPSLAFIKRQHVEQPAVPEKNEWHNQLALDRFVESEYAALQDRLNLGSGHAMREYERAAEAEIHDTDPSELAPESSR